MTNMSLQNRLKLALREDEAQCDITSRLLPISSTEKATFVLVAKQKGVFCGASLLFPVFSLLDRRVKVKVKKKDGANIFPGQTLATIHGRIRALLSGERVYLNLACHLSGIATLTRRYVEAVKETSAVICDTRKTTPLWRDLEKFAVRCGGGTNHRFSLKDAILIKDNHLGVLKEKQLYPFQIYEKQKLPLVVKRAVSFVEMEATTIDEVWQAIKARVDIILLDNMAPKDVQMAMELIRAARRVFGDKKPLVEVSGGVNLETVKNIASWGVDRISVGAITHSAPRLDLSLEVS